MKRKVFLFLFLFVSCLYATVIPPKMLSNPSSVFHVWMKFYEDKKAGVAFYVDID